MAKQVEKTPETTTVSPTKASNLYFAVETFDRDNKKIGSRIVDLYHFGTRDWLSNHQWWALHNGHTVETRTASGEEINEYLDKAKLALAEKFNSTSAKAA